MRLSAKIVCNRLIIVIALLAPAVMSAPGDEVSVCEALVRAPSINGEAIMISGELVSTAGGLILIDESGGSIEIAGVRVPCELAIEHASGKSSAKIRVKLNEAANMMRAAKRRTFLPPLFTIKGVVQSDPSRIRSIRNPPGLPPAGYGHLGLRPGQVDLLDIISIKFKYAPDH